MRKQTRLILSLIMLFALFAIQSVCWSAPMKLADNGSAACTIVIPQQAEEAEKYAASELALFLKEITGVVFNVITDSTPASGSEIVLGNTNRLKMSDVPEKLLPKKWEGFVIYRKDSSLYIIGKIPRATLYGVYDMLEIELGCRFLAPGVNHVPKKANLSVNFKSRKYDPPMEYRSIWTNPDDVWLVRNRFNSRGENWIPMEEQLGGVRWINYWFVHTFVHMVSPGEFEATHPEYFALIDGKRQGTMDGVVTQLCLTNPDVYEITLKRVRAMVESANKQYAQAKYSKLLVSVSENDNGNFCQCSECKKVNEEEGSPNGGTLIRFVNKIAKEIGKDYPNVEIETLAYGMMPAPPKTKPEKNVVIRWARWIHNGYPLDSKVNKSNWGLYNEIRGWKKVTDRIYHWGYYINFWDYLAPYPHQNNLDHNIRVLVKNGVVGMFAQNSSDLGSEFQQLRSYMLAKAEWRPETSGAKTQAEFCKLYYGKGSGKILEYIKILNRNYRDYTKIADLPDSFVEKSNKMLGDAERLADTPETKHRIAIARLPIWKIMIDRAMVSTGKLADLPVEWKFKFDADDSGIKEEWFKQTDFSAWKPIKINDWWTNQGEKRRGTGWYGVEFEIPKTDKKSLSLYFGAIDGICDVYVDGNKIGEQKLDPYIMWNKPFAISLPDSIGPGKHTIVIRVEKHEYSAGIWQLISISDMSAPISPEVREACERFISVGSSIPLRQLSEGGRGVDVSYYPLIQSFLKLK